MRIPLSRAASAALCAVLAIGQAACLPDHKVELEVQRPANEECAQFQARARRSLQELPLRSPAEWPEGEWRGLNDKGDRMLLLQFAGRVRASLHLVALHGSCDLVVRWEHAKPDPEPTEENRAMLLRVHKALQDEFGVASVRVTRPGRYFVTP